MTLEQLLTHYGYVVLLLGTFLEGETIVVIAGFLARRGHLELPWVIAVAFIGTFIIDQIFFHLGRVKGGAILEKRPAWKDKASRVISMMQRHQLWLILGFRFLYGLRTVTPILLGVAGVSSLRFLLLDAIAAFVWAVIFSALGYFLGQAVEAVIGEMKQHEVWVIAIIALVGTGVWLVRRFNRKRRAARATGAR